MGFGIRVESEECSTRRGREAGAMKEYNNGATHRSTQRTKRGMSRSQEVGLVALIFLVAFLTLHYFSGYIYDFQGSDAAIYGIVARNIVEKNSMVSQNIWATWKTFQILGTLPQTLEWKERIVYVYIVAFFFRIFGSSFWTMKLVNVTFGSLLVIPVFYLTKALFDREKAVIASFFSFLYPLLIIGSIVPGDKALHAFVIMSAIAFLAPRRGIKIWNILLGGIFCGLAFLARYDFGGALFVSGLILYSLGAHLEGGPLKKRVVTSGLFSVAFALTILPLLIRNNRVLRYSLAITGVVAQMLTESDAVFLSLEFVLGAFGAFFLIWMLFSSMLLAIVPLVRRHLSKLKKVDAVLVIASIVISLTFLLVRIGWLTYVFSLFSVYPQMIYQSSPLIFVFALVGAVASNRKIGLLHPVYTLPAFIIAIYTALLEAGGLGATYMIPYIPLVTIFATSAVFDISQTLSRSSIGNDLPEVPKRMYKLRHIWAPKHLMLIFLIGSIFLSFVPHYLIITQADKVQKGPFLIDNWDKAYDWVSANTHPNDTIMARYPPVTFYTRRRTITLEPMNMTQLITILKVGRVSYLIIDDTAYVENKRVDNSMIPWLYDYPQRSLGFALVYQVEDPRLLIFDVRQISMENATIAWSDHNFTSGWTVDPRLTFAGDGNFVEMAYDNTDGSSTAFLSASKTLPSPINFSEYPFIIIRYKFNYWTTPRYPPPLYFRAFLFNSEGTEFASETAPHPVDDNDIGWHTLVWSPIEAIDIAKITLLIRIEVGTKFSVIVDYVVISDGPVYIGG